MSIIFYYILQLVEFLLVISIGISLVSFILYYLSSKFNIKFINVYGFFSGMDDASLILLSCSILKQITLIYCIFKLSNFSVLYLYIFLIFSFTYSFFTFKVSTFIKEIMVGGIEYLILYFLSLLSSFLVEVQYSRLVIYYIWILSGILICCSLYFFVRNLSFIITRNKNVRRNLIAR